ncbi:MAG: hypothetical protein RR282_00555 [Acinetobacter sp.]
MSKYDWGGVPDKYKFMATDSDGDIFAYVDKPNTYDDFMWYGGNALYIGVDMNIDWQDSLEERPK